MKFYEVPTMNISEFAVENVVTESATALARAEMGANASEYTKLEKDWNAIN